MYKRKIAEEEEKEKDGKKKKRDRSHENSKAIRANLEHLKKNCELYEFFNFATRAINILVFYYIYEN